MYIRFQVDTYKSRLIFCKFEKIFYPYEKTSDFFVSDL